MIDKTIFAVIGFLVWGMVAMISNVLAGPPDLSPDIKRMVKSATPLPGTPEVDIAMPLANPENVRRVMRIVPESRWNELFPLRNKGYTYEEFLKAVAKYPALCNEKAPGVKEDLDQVCAMELVTIFGHMTQESSLNSTPQDLPNKEPNWKQGLYHLHEMNCSNEKPGCDYTGAGCAPGSWQNDAWPCVEGKKYFGRGAKQLTYNYNYGPFSKTMFGDVNVLLKDPDRVANEPWLAISSAMWFYMNPQSPKPSIHDIVVGFWKLNEHDLAANIPLGFGATINVINGCVECRGETEKPEAKNRMAYYVEFAKAFGVDPGDNIGCAGMKDFPANGAGSVDIYWERDWSNQGKCKLVGYQTSYTLLFEQDYEACVIHHFGKE